MLAAIAAACSNAWTLGRTHVSRERETLLRTTANENNPFDLAYSGVLAARIHIQLREYEQAADTSARALELSEKHRFPYQAALSRCIFGRSLAQLGRTGESIALIERGLASLLEIHTRVGISAYTLYLGEAKACEDALAEALEAVQESLLVNPDELAYRSEALRVRGELRLKHGHAEQAAGDFLESIGLARKIGAKAWELRTTMSLARLLAKQNRRDEARSMLAEIYNWFTEGFDTADLKDAKALLDELAT
jgi:tetratricopeptide (TPR) repeat protein